MLLNATSQSWGQSIRVIVADCHQERTGAIYTSFTDWTPTVGPDGQERLTMPITASYRHKVVWDPNEIDQVHDDLQGLTEFDDFDEEVHDASINRLQTCFETLMPGLREVYEGSYGDPEHDVWVVLEGDMTGMLRVFDELCQTLTEPTGGDDDTFDYWPSGFDLLTVFANNLDEATAKLRAAEDSADDWGYYLDHACLTKARSVWDKINADHRAADGDMPDDWDEMTPRP